MLTIVQVMRDGYNLDCWKTGGEHFVVEPPEKPYFYTRDFHPLGDWVTRRLLSRPDEDIIICKVSVGSI